MSIGEICSREVIVAEAEDTVLVAARLMREHHVGNVLVVEARDGKRVPIGIVTDRDVVVEVLALELDPGAITVGDIMVPNLVTVKESTGVSDAIECMRTRGVRRLPVVNEDGGRPRWGQVVGRTFARLIPLEPFSVLFSNHKKRRGWHDSLSKTYVVRRR